MTLALGAILGTPGDHAQGVHLVALQADVPGAVEVLALQDVHLGWCGPLRNILYDTFRHIY